jgi:hypothetical protein
MTQARYIEKLLWGRGQALVKQGIHWGSDGGLDCINEFSSYETGPDRLDRASPSNAGHDLLLLVYLHGHVLLNLQIQV